MTSLRILAFASSAIGLAIAGAGLLPARRSAPAAVRAAAPSPSAISTTSRAAAGAATPPANAAPDLRDVPPNILSRAASARALERAPGGACRPRARGDASCAPQRDTVEIHWDVGKDP